MSRDTDSHQRLRPPVSRRILTALALPDDATEDDAVATIRQLQGELAATRPRVATELPARVKFWRQRAGLKAFELARKMGLSPAAVSTWQSGKSVPDHETLERFCFTVGISLVDFWSPLPENDDATEDGETGNDAPPNRRAASA